jgi:transposase InsO family protein
LTIAFILGVYSQCIVAWHAQTTKHTELVMIPLRMALWERRVSDRLCKGVLLLTDRRH